MRKLTIIISVIIVILMCSCSKMDKTPNEGKVLEDYKEVATHLSYANLSKAEFVRQQYKKEEMKFVADVKFTGNDDYANFTCTATLTYNYYNDEGWMLDEHSSTGSAIRCYTGRTFEEVKNQLEKDPLPYIPMCSYIEVLDLETQLDRNMEIVTVNYETYDKHLVKYYENAKLTFVYGQGRWELLDIDKEINNVWINLENTTWETDEYSNLNIKITDISDDSRQITFVCRGEEYIGVMTDDYSEETFTEYYTSYKLNKILPLGSVWGVSQSADNFTIHDLTGNDDVWIYFDNSKLYNGGYGAGYHLVGDAPEWWTYEDER